MGVWLFQTTKSSGVQNQTLDDLGSGKFISIG